MKYLNLDEALEGAKNGEIFGKLNDTAIYSMFNDERKQKYFTLHTLIKGVVEYYNLCKYPNHNIDILLQGWKDVIEDYIERYEKDKNTDNYFNYEYVRDYIENSNYIWDYDQWCIDELAEYVA